jgi:hypothetical protein
MTPSPEAQERWHRWYEEASKKQGSERELVGTFLRRLDARRFWQRVLMIGSTVFIAGLTTVFYNVLSR